MYLIYSFALTIGFLILLPRFLWDTLRKGKYTAGFWQRFGFLPEFDAGGKPVIWLHAVSVGETNAAKPLVKEIIKNFPDHKLVVSTTTKTGQTLAREIFKHEAALVFYFPFDWAFVVRRALEKINPSVVLIMETELWFNFLREVRRREIKIALVNGRLSEKSFKNYKLIQPLLRRALANLDLALMGGERDAERLLELGAALEKTFVTGNIKFDLETVKSDLTETLRGRFKIDNARPLIVAASTHSPEERWILESYKILRSNFPAENTPRLLIVPRHPERFGEVADMMQNTGFRSARRSVDSSKTDVDADLILLDSIGELRAVYELAELVFVGGSLIPHGGQNVLEPASAKKAIVTGFYTMNFAAIVQEFLRCSAIVQLPQLAENQIPARLSEVLSELLNDEKRRKCLSENAFAVLYANRGAVEKSIKLLAPLFRLE
ncbi:MAG: 3-deoxy-D-manno-octulosonic acid transferase [Acidobacteriota bacterium]|nr:3-deoxy-D-manno-octulosonic acid transferase [Acidobacteriota bacterium]